MTYRNLFFIFAGFFTAGMVGSVGLLLGTAAAAGLIAIFFAIKAGQER